MLPLLRCCLGAMLGSDAGERCWGAMLLGPLMLPLLRCCLGAMLGQLMRCCRSDCWGADAGELMLPLGAMLGSRCCAAVAMLLGSDAALGSDAGERCWGAMLGRNAGE